ncbi:MAG: SusC/RagA family TonB-linked outer membrane protein [Bacteroidota bacterium]
MKLTTSLIFIASLQIFANESYSQGVRLSFDLEETTVEQVLSEIEDLSEFYFLFNDKLVDVDRKVNLHLSNQRIEEVLTQVFDNTDVGFLVMDRQIVLSPNEYLTQSASAFQPVTVTGTVTDENGQPLPGVNVYIKGTTQGTITDANGNYSLDVQDGDALLVFSSVGLTMQEVPVGNRTVIDITLNPDITALEEIVVTALGIKREEKSLGYSVTSVQGEDIVQAQTTSPISALQGKSAGVQINTTAGGTSASPRITIRGNSTLGANTQPIFVVDGIIVDNDVSGAYGNQLKNLNPDDFESISVLKGAAATALYGTRALHGVVLITTKSGTKRQGLGVSFNQSLGVRQVYDSPAFQNEYGYGPTAGMFSNHVTNGRPDGDKHDNQQFAFYETVNGQLYGSLQHNNSEETAASWGPRFDGQDYIDYDGSMAKWEAQPDNYRKMFETGLVNSTNLAIEGGGESNTFRLSYTNFIDKGVQPMNDFSKNSISIKGTQEVLKDIITVGAGMHYTKAKVGNPPSNTLEHGWFHDGFPRSYDVDKWRDNYKDVDGGVPYPTNSSTYMYSRKSMAWFNIYEKWYDRDESSLLANVFMDVNIAKGLTGSIKANFNEFTTKDEIKVDATSIDRLSNASYHLGHGGRFQSSLLANLFYEKELNENLRFDLLVGAETWSSDVSSSGYSTYRGFKIRDWYNIKNSFGSPVPTGGIGNSKTINSVYSYLNLDYKSTLYLSLTGRNDWSTALVYPTGTGDYSYFYPSASLSWVVSNSLSLPESIFAKVRASYAMVGNDTDPYLLSSGFVTQNFSQEPNMGLYKFESTTAISPNIRPETKKSFEAGFDLRLKNGRAGIDVAYYKDNTHDQIIPLNVPTESGITRQLINAGNLQNQGVEVMIDVTPVESGDFSWDVGFAFTHNRDKIIELYPGVTEVILAGNPNDAGTGTATFAFVGGDYGDLTTRQGLNPYEGENSANHGLPVLSQRNNWSVAYMNGRQNLDSLVRMGNMQPDWYGSVNTNLRYKGFNLYALFDMSFGGDIFSYQYRYGLHQGVLESTLENRDAEHGGIVWTSQGMGNNYYGKEYQDGYIPEGVFPDGTVITFRDADGNVTTQNDVGGMSYQDAYDQGLVEPTHWSGYMYRWTSASTGGPTMAVFESNWVVLRELSLSYVLPGSLFDNNFISSAKISLTGRDLGFLHNSAPDNINPAISNNRAGEARQIGFAPYIRSIILAARFTF